MSTYHDPDRLIRAFLDEGQTELPVRTYDAVREHIEGTRQRVVIGPWREPNMSNIVRFAAAAAAVLVLAVGASQILPRDGGSGGSSPSPSPTPSMSPSASATVRQTLIVEAPFPADITLEVDDGWALWGDVGIDGKGWYKVSPDPPGIVFSIWTAANVFASPCGSNTGALDPPIGGTVDDLADALVAQPGTVVHADRPVTVDGYSGRFLDYTADYAVGNCDGGHLNRWTAVNGTRREALDGEHDQVWILDVDGQRIILDASDFPSTSAAHRAELEAVIESVQISPN